MSSESPGPYPAGLLGKELQAVTPAPAQQVDSHKHCATL